MCAPVQVQVEVFAAAVGEGGAQREPLDADVVHESRGHVKPVHQVAGAVTDVDAVVAAAAHTASALPAACAGAIGTDGAASLIYNKKQLSSQSPSAISPTLLDGEMSRIRKACAGPENQTRRKRHISLSSLHPSLGLTASLMLCHAVRACWLDAHFV